IRDKLVTGVQTCALPIFPLAQAQGEGEEGGLPAAAEDELRPLLLHLGDVGEQVQEAELAKQRQIARQQRLADVEAREPRPLEEKIGRASCRERVERDGEG